MLIYNFGDWTEWIVPQKVTFLPDQKLIEIHPGTTQIDVQVDLYSAWKEWIRYYDNAKWSAAFTTFGGDPTGESQYAPRYFFLTNGWKVYAKDMSVVVQMNLYSDDGLSPFVIDNAAITNRASDVPIVRSEVERRLDYGDRVYVDENSIYVGIEYPNGTIAQPVNNMTDAISLANLYNIKSFYFLSDLNIIDSGIIYENYSFYADRENLTILISEGNYMNNIDWTGFIIDGNFGGGINKFIDCIIINALDVSGQMKDCQMNGVVRIWNSLVTSMCYSGIAGSATPIWDMHQYRATSLSIRSYSGGVDLRWCNFPADVTTVELIAGQIKLNENCTSGYIDLRGVGYLNNLSSGSTVKTTGFIDSFENYIEESSAITEILSYQNSIYFDPFNGYTGVTYPIGTSAYPSNNIPSLFYLSNTLNIKNIYIRQELIVSGTTSFLPPGQKMDYFTLFADAPGVVIEQWDNGLTTNVQINGFDVNLAYFSGLTNHFDDCSIGDVYDIAGKITNSGLRGRKTYPGSTIRVGNNATFDSCYPAIAYDQPYIALTNPNGTECHISNYSGNIFIESVLHPNDIIVFDLQAGKVTLGSGCTAGIIDIRGVGYLINNAGTGCTIITTGLVDSFGSYIDATREVTERNSYGDRIYIDETSIFTGTTYPMGTIGYPINNPSDALNVAQQHNISDFYALSDIYVNNITGLTFDSLSFFADRENLNFITTGNTFNNIDFNGFTIDMDFGSGIGNKINDSIVINALNLNGNISNSQLGTPSRQSTIKIHQNLITSNCFSGNVGGFISKTPIFDMVVGVESHLAIRNYSGGVNIINCDTIDSQATIDLTGQAKFDSTCTAGFIDLRGVGYYINNAGTGCTIKTDGFVNSFGTYIEETRSTTETLAYGGKIYVDQISGTTGTTYPAGTIIDPVKDPMYLSSKLGIEEFWAVSDYIYAPTGYTRDILVTAAHPNLNLTILSGQNIELSRFSGFYIVDAQMEGNFNTFDKCIVLSATNFHGHMYDSEIWGDVSVHTHLDLWRCWGDHFGRLSTVTTHTEIGIVNWSGDLLLGSNNINDEFLINMSSGKVTIESGCTTGIIDLRGVGYLIDNSSGATVITTGLVSQTLTSEDVATLTGLTSSIDEMTIAIELLDDKVSYISGTTYEMNENVLIMTSGFTAIEESISGMTDSVNVMSVQVSGLDTQVKRILGLSQENFRIMDHVYVNDNLSSASVKIYSDSSDCDNDINPLSTYSMIALYDAGGKLIDYKVTKN